MWGSRKVAFGSGRQNYAKLRYLSVGPVITAIRVELLFLRARQEPYRAGHV